MVQKVIQLRCDCNQYPWGEVGQKSLAAVLCSKTPGTEFKLKDDTPYSEMWMGTYPELPSYVLETGEDLQDVLDKSPKELIGDTVVNKFGHTKLPYLPKVLSIAKALPLQLHPNKELSAKLHKEDPSNFTDPNHKPEIGLALTDFEAFCGFKTLDEINALVKLDPVKPYLPEGKETISDNETLRKFVSILLKAEADDVSKTYDALAKISPEDLGKQSYILDLLPRLKEQYTKEDNGIIVALITMNYLQLKPGQCLYIPADGIHAYLSGHIIECMARSNNVLNTGFCPRADRNNVDLFCSVLTFSPHSAQECILPQKIFDRSSNKKTIIYNPPLSEFAMLSTEVESGQNETVGKLGGPSILLVTKGEGKMNAEGKEYDLSDGYIYFIGQGVELKFDASKDLQIFTAFVE